MSKNGVVAFVCLHGSAKSLIAAEYLSRRARERGLALSGTTSGPEPDAEIPANVVEGLRRHGIEVDAKRPMLVTAATLGEADHLVSFAVDLGHLAPSGRAVERWDDCPAVSDDFDVAWRFIAGKVDGLLDRLAK